MIHSLEQFGVDLQIKDGSKRKKAYSIGYEGKTAEEFFLILKNNKIRNLLDVRDSPNSKKNMFSSKKFGVIPISNIA